MITTKEQERKALEKIRKIVAELGEDSYVATAFEGCLEDAEQNIENDFALSYYDRYNDCTEEINRLDEEVEFLNGKVKAYQKTFEDIDKERKAEAAKLAETENRLALAEGRLEKFFGMRERTMKVLNEKRERLISDADQAAVAMATFAEREDAEGLADAVKWFKESKAELAELDTLIQELERT